jgi:hypothetical protein
MFVESGDACDYRKILTLKAKKLTALRAVSFFIQ